MNYQLKNISEKDFGTVYELQTGKNLLGRSRSATIRILLDDISGKHCILHFDGIHVRLENMSRFGTKVNGHKVMDSVDLVSGDIIKLGTRCKLLLENLQDDATVYEEETPLISEAKTECDAVIDLSKDSDVAIAGALESSSGKIIQTVDADLIDKKKSSDSKDEKCVTSVTHFPENIEQNEIIADTPADDMTAAPHFVGDIDNEISSDVPAEDATVATRFAGDIDNETSSDVPAEDATAATRFVGDIDNEISSDVPAEDATAATHFVGDIENKISSDVPEEDMTAATRFAGDIDNETSSDVPKEDSTAATRFAEEDATLSVSKEKNKTVKRSLWQIIKGIFGSKKQTLDFSDEENFTDFTKNSIEGTLSEAITLSSNEKTDEESQEISTSVDHSEDVTLNIISDTAESVIEDEAQPDHTAVTKFESKISEEASVTWETKTESALVSEDGIKVNLNGCSDSVGLPGDTTENKKSDIQPVSSDESILKQIQEKKAENLQTEAELHNIDVTGGTESVKTRTLTIPVAFDMEAETESVEQFEEEVHQEQNASEEFFEEEESGDKTNPDPDDIPRFFEEDEFDNLEKTNVNETQMLQTRIASLDEISYIKEQVKRRQQKRFFLRVSIFTAIAFALFVIWHLRAPQQEKVLSWPLTHEEQLAVGTTVTPFEKGWEQGGFDLYYPDCGKKTVIQKISSDILEIRTFIGSNADTPLRITLLCRRFSQILEESRKQSFTRLLAEMMKNKKELFTFDKNSTVIFLGTHNGILCNVISYQRDQNNKSYWGKLYYFRYGDIFYCLTAEVPLDDKSRARQLLEDNHFFDISQKFEFLYWEGTGDFVRGDMLSRIDEIEDDVRRKSPYQFSSLERGLQSVLIQASLENNQKLKEKGSELLAKLRKNEHDEYRAFVRAWIEAQCRGDIQEKRRIKNESAGVFSLESDRRRTQILQDIWE